MLTFPKMGFSNFGYSNVLNFLLLSNFHSLTLMTIKMPRKEGQRVTLIQGSWKHSPEASAGVMAPSLNCIFTEIGTLWMKSPGLLGRDEDPVSTYVLLYGCCFTPRFRCLGWPHTPPFPRQLWRSFQNRDIGRSEPCLQHSEVSVPEGIMCKSNIAKSLMSWSLCFFLAS